MTRTRRLAVAMVAAAVLAAPLLAAAAEACAGCCCAAVPCHAAESPCDASFAPMPCGDGSPAVPAAADRAHDRQPFQAVLPAASRPGSNELGAIARTRARAPEREVAALRLSVVRRL
jgi:hypothetical protein